MAYSHSISYSTGVCNDCGLTIEEIVSHKAFVCIGTLMPRPEPEPETKPDVDHIWHMIELVSKR